MSGNTGSWSIPADDAFLAALEGGTQTVTFDLYAELAEGENGIPFAEIQQTVSKDSMTGVNLGSVAVPNFITLSGTVTVTDDGSPIPRVSINARNPQGHQIGYTSLVTPVAGAAWSMKIPAFDNSTVVTFDVSGYDENWNTQLFSKTVSPTETTAVKDEDVSGIALNIGDISEAISE
jgi:hypothetical protein